MTTSISRSIGSLFVDSLCIASIVGIWPRFIEPRLVLTTHLKWKLSKEQAHLDGLRIVQFSDLHFHEKLSARFLKKIHTAIERVQPDLILFTGDFLCYSHLRDAERLKNFLAAFSAPLGCYCVFGNHDYASYVSRNREGIHDVLTPANPASGLFRAIRAVLQKKIVNGVFSEKARAVPLNEGLVELLKATPFTLLENTCVTLPIGLNIVGLGEYGLGRSQPKTAFAKYQEQFPGIVLSHNPDTLPTLSRFPGQWIFCGHTHGEQVHFPFMRSLSKKLTRAENPEYTRGPYQIGQKIAYVNRGIGCHKPLRFCSPPEILCVTLQYAK